MAGYLQGVLISRGATSRHEASDEIRTPDHITRTNLHTSLPWLVHVTIVSAHTSLAARRAAD